MFNPHLFVGQILTEKEVHDTFECQTTLGIRMSNKNNLIVIMSGSAKKKVYSDRWEGDILYYNGTDINSDDSSNQTLTKGKGNNNSQLRQVWFDSPEKRRQIFLFEKHISNQCIYKGEVELCQEPRLEPRHDNPSRTVWIFPLKLKIIDSEQNNLLFSEASAMSTQANPDELAEKALEKSRINAESSSTNIHSAITTSYERDPDIAAYAKMRANGVCELCGCPAPFIGNNGQPYLESHHIDWLCNGGKDIIENIAALCPNCHRKMHLLNYALDIQKLKDKAKHK